MLCIKSCHHQRTALRTTITAKQHTTAAAACKRAFTSFSSSIARPSLKTPVRLRPLHYTTARVPCHYFSSTSSKMAPPPASAHEFLDFVNASPTPYHAVQTATSLLQKAGFHPISERTPWTPSTISPGGKYYLTRNASSLIAFAVGSRWSPGNPIAMIGAHTDSPCLRVKPVSKRTANGYLQVGVETYGGGIWHSWFDRDLSVAGRVLVRVKEGGFEQRLVRVEKPIVRIPSLAIHLHRQSNFDPNKEEEMVPIAGLVEEVLNKKGDVEEGEEEEFEPLKAIDERHHSEFLKLIAKEAGVDKVEDVQDFELILYDTQKAVLGGMNEEFIYSGRLDNLDMTFCAVKALIGSVKDGKGLEEETGIRLVACFDHEEIGSLSAHGADSNLLPAVLRRLSVLPGVDGNQQSESNETAFEQTLAKSFLISADMAHAVHPNYAGKYERNHQPQMNKGTVIKINANQRYATNSPGIVLVKECARRKGVPLQLFVVKNDSPCGSTIGPMLSAKLGVRTLDLGNPQLAMHSIREMGGSWDVEHAIGLFEGFLEGYGGLEGGLVVD